MSNLQSYFSKSRELLIDVLRRVAGFVVQKVRLDTAIEKNRCDIQNSDLCAKLKSQRDDVIQSIVVQKLAFEKALPEEVKNRRPAVTAELEKLPAEIQKDLCKRALGYASFVNCDRYL